MKYLNILQYFDYRELLKDYYATRKSVDSQFSYRSFAKDAGIKSLGLYQRLVKGEVNLSESSFPKICQGLELNPEDIDYFRLLVDYTHSQSFEKKQVLFEKMLGFQDLEEMKVVNSQKRYYSKWYSVAIHQSLDVLSIKGTKQDIENLSQFIQPNISFEQAQQTLEALISLKMIQKDENGFWKSCTNTLTGTGKEVAKNAIHQFQKSMMNLAQEGLDTIPKNERNILTSTFSISENGKTQLDQLINQFQNNVMKLIQADSNENQICQLNLQLFPISSKKEHNS